MGEKQKPILTFERRVHTRIHYKYSLDEQREIWRCLWLSKQVSRYGERIARWIVGAVCICLAVGALWQHYPQTAWIGLIVPIFAYKARRAYTMRAWHRVKLATLVHGKEPFYETLDECLAEARAEVEEDDPTVDIKVEFNPEELP